VDLGQCPAVSLGMVTASPGPCVGDDGYEPHRNSMNRNCVWKPVVLLAMWLATPRSVVAQSRTPDGAQRRGPDESPQFFPSEAFGGNRSILAVAYSWYLRSMQESPLAQSVRPECPQAYRLLVEVRPYNAPLVVRLVVLANRSGALVTKVGRDGGHPHILTVNRTTGVPGVYVQKFLALLDNADFWSMPTERLWDIHKPVAMGEGGWMLEGIREGRYHIVHRARSELGPLKDPLDFLVVRVANLDLGALPIGPQANGPAGTQR
jgi:hypothetical protein